MATSSATRRASGTPRAPNALARESVAPWRILARSASAKGPVLSGPWRLSLRNNFNNKNRPGEYWELEACLSLTGNSLPVKSPSTGRVTGLFSHHFASDVFKLFRCKLWTNNKWRYQSAVISIHLPPRAFYHIPWTCSHRTISRLLWTALSATDRGDWTQWRKHSLHQWEWRHDLNLA